jgi:hypothetical protein
LQKIEKGRRKRKKGRRKSKKREKDKKKMQLLEDALDDTSHATAAPRSKGSGDCCCGSRPS